MKRLTPAQAMIWALCSVESLLGDSLLILSRPSPCSHTCSFSQINISLRKSIIKCITFENSSGSTGANCFKTSGGHPRSAPSAKFTSHLQETPFQVQGCPLPFQRTQKASTFTVIVSLSGAMCLATKSHVARRPAQLPVTHPSGPYIARRTLPI